MLNVLHPDHHGIRKQPALFWIDGPVPDDFEEVGKVKVPPDLAGSSCDTYGGWMSLHYAALTQWRWEHDRTALLAEEAAEQEEAERQYQQTLDELEHARRSMSLEELCRYTFFPEWDDFPPRRVITSARKSMKTMAQELVSLGDKSTRKQKLAVVKQCIDRFNDLSAKHGEIGDTAVREDILDAVTLFETATGIKDLATQADRWRDW